MGTGKKGSETGRRAGRGREKQKFRGRGRERDRGWERKGRTREIQRKTERQRERDRKTGTQTVYSLPRPVDCLEPLAQAAFPIPGYGTPPTLPPHHPPLVSQPSTLCQEGLLPHGFLSPCHPPPQKASLPGLTSDLGRLGLVAQSAQSPQPLYHPHPTPGAAAQIDFLEEEGLY